MPFRSRYRITSPYGPRVLNGVQEFHNGIDLVGIDDITVQSPLSGVVLLSAYGTECGNQIQLYTATGVTLFFCHLASCAVKTGEQVARGQTLGVMGNTGTKTTGAHLHFGVYEGRGRAGKTLDPALFLGI